VNAIEVIGLGAMNMDHIYGVERILGDGETTAVEFRLSPGGSAANTIYALAKLGISTGFIGAVGDDGEGEMLVKDLASVGVDGSQIKAKKGAKTGSVLCLSDKRGRRALYVLPGANSLLTGGDVDLAYLSQAKMLHLSSFADEQQLAIQQELMAKISPSLKVSFAPGSIYTAKGMSALEPIIRRADILFLNREEAEELTGVDFQTGAQRLRRLGCQSVAVTLGQGIRRGKSIATCYVASGEGEHMIETRRTKRTDGDTIGAGDAFAAGFIYGLLHGKELKECGHLGDVLARFSITKIGARAGLPSLPELSQHYQRERGLPL